MAIAVTDGASATRWAKVIDHTRCIGCHACSTACKSENEVPLGVNRTYVKYVDVGVFPAARRAFQVTRCNQCENPPCVTACPTAAMHQRPDGIVDFDKSICIGCKACIAACPYDAIFINPQDHSAEKCNFCAHRLDVGLEPACVVVCPTEAIVVGDMNDPLSRLASYVHQDAVTVRRPEKETHPKLFYKGAHGATLDPLAAERPEGGLFMWSEQGRVPHGIPAGVAPGAAAEKRAHARLPGGDVADANRGNSSAAAILAYDVPHRAPWDFRVSLYTFTKSIAAGAFLVPVLLVAMGHLTFESDLWNWATPLLAGAFLALTGVILIWDLEHPKRFLYVLIKPQPRSWLVRGGFIITGYGGVLALLFAENFTTLGPLSWWLVILGIPLAAMTAIYTAFLFAQAKARDLWQSPLLPPHLLVQAVMAGSGALIPVAIATQPDAIVPLSWVFAVSNAVHLLMVLGETTLTHVTTHAHLALREMIKGRYANYFWVSVLLSLAAFTVVPMPMVGVVTGMLGLLAFEHAYVQAGQSVPLA
ncbi:MAG: polysulfide reductase NrfD [Gemmatimonadales bacterium]|jgi:Fe-S-cluster-containing dehydrogenase component/formate-dependent nitrite reductase membrane component NrfD|nr:MAG: polysulfide reductase NrfD [Gemmatimonadales bacterium]